MSSLSFIFIVMEVFNCITSIICYKNDDNWLKVIVWLTKCDFKLVIILSTINMSIYDIKIINFFN